jgi:NAD(P)-dependent dehydrogenase (short-subunit alcohol dehydrogenase family)
MARKGLLPGGAELQLNIDRATGKVSGLVAAQMHWTSMPVHRASKKFEEIWAWLERCGAADWERVHSLASYFHPGYMLDPKTGNFEPERAKGAPVYLSMEAKKYEPRLVRALAPTIAGSIPRGSRGTPPEYLKAILFVCSPRLSRVFSVALFASGQRGR